MGGKSGVPEPRSSDVNRKREEASRTVQRHSVPARRNVAGSFSQVDGGRAALDGCRGCLSRGGSWPLRSGSRARLSSLRPPACPSRRVEARRVWFRTLPPRATAFNGRVRAPPLFLAPPLPV